MEKLADMISDKAAMPLLLMFIGFGIKELWDLVKGLLQKKEDARETAINEATKATNQNTLALVQLSSDMKNVLKAIEEIPKMRKDLDSAHEKIREMQNGHGKPRRPSRSQ